MPIGNSINTEPKTVISAPAILFFTLINKTMPIANVTRPTSNRAKRINVRNIGYLLSVFMVEIDDSWVVSDLSLYY